jgi:hypothetical protein
MSNLSVFFVTFLILTFPLSPYSTSPYQSKIGKDEQAEQAGKIIFSHLE